MTVTQIKNEEKLKEFVSEGQVVLMIHKKECPFCDKAMPWFEEFSETFTDRKFAEVEKDDIVTLLTHFNIEMYPTFVLINNGIIQDTFFGDTQKEKVKEFVSKEIKELE